MTGNKHTFTISPLSVVQIIFILLAFAFVWMIRDIVIIFFIALILASAFDPFVDMLQRRRVPRAVGVIIIYVLFLGALSFIVLQLAGTIAGEVRGLARNIPQYYDAVNQGLQKFMGSAQFLTGSGMTQMRGGLDDIVQNLTRLASGNVTAVISALFGGIVSVVLIFVITFYIVVQESAVKSFIIWLVPGRLEQKTARIMEMIQKKIGLWFRGQMLLSLIIFVLTYVGLKILGVQYALVLALLAGLAEIVPYLGPVISSIPAIFLTLTTGGFFRALLVLGLYVLIQQMENNIIVPKVMSKTVGLNPLVVILSILIGAKVAGVAGAIMAVPVATALTVLIQEWKRKDEAAA